MNTSGSSRKPRSATTASSARNSICSPSTRRVGPGLVLWHPKGALVRFLMEDFCKREHLANGYELVDTPHVGRGHLWETSGHLEFYRENMYAGMEIDDETYYAKPMNCPFHIHDLPFPTALVPRPSDALGRTGHRVPLRENRRPARVDARARVHPGRRAHLLHAGPDPAESIARCTSACILRAFGFSEFPPIWPRVRRRPWASGAVGRRPTGSLRGPLDRSGAAYASTRAAARSTDRRSTSKITDAIGREWQCSTIQFDFNLPERFDMTLHRRGRQGPPPYMVHRALLGSHRAVLRRPDRALRRRVPGLAGAGAGPMCIPGAPVRRTARPPPAELLALGAGRTTPSAGPGDGVPDAGDPAGASKPGAQAASRMKAVSTYALSAPRVVLRADDEMAHSAHRAAWRAAAIASSASAAARDCRVRRVPSRRQSSPAAEAQTGYRVRDALAGDVRRVSRMSRYSEGAGPN